MEGLVWNLFASSGLLTRCTSIIVCIIILQAHLENNAICFNDILQSDHCNSSNVLNEHCATMEGWGFRVFHCLAFLAIGMCLPHGVHNPPSPSGEWCKLHMIGLVELKERLLLLWYTPNLNTWLVLQFWYWSSKFFDTIIDIVCSPVYLSNISWNSMHSVPMRYIPQMDHCNLSDVLKNKHWSAKVGASLESYFASADCFKETEEMILKLPLVWILAFIHLHVSLILCVSWKWTSWKLEGPWRIFPPSKVLPWTVGADKLACAQSPPRTSSYVSTWMAEENHFPVTCILPLWLGGPQWLGWYHIETLVIST